MFSKSFRFRALAGVCASLGLWTAGNVQASSHREAPGITETPKVDGTDFYMFRSYEVGRQDFVTLVACYLPLQDPYGGPNYFAMDPDALYEIHIDNNGDAVEDLTFQFRFQNANQDISLNVGNPGEEISIPVPVINVGTIGPEVNATAALNVIETFTVNLIRGDRRDGSSMPITNASTGLAIFRKPVDNIGNKTIPDYDLYANNHIYDITIPGCAAQGRMFVGQRKDPFVVNLGETFDLINVTNVLGATDAERDSLEDKNVTALILEIPINCLIGGDSIIGAWTTASLVTSESPLAAVQRSRLGSPLVNEVVIGLRDKDDFNGSEPMGDARFANYVTHPSFPEIVQLLYSAAGVQAPNLFPRSDLVEVFLTGVAGLTRPAAGVVPSEMLRLNTSTQPTAVAVQNALGVVGGDIAGFPNGRRPGDDVVDIVLRVAMGALLTEDLAPSGQLPYTDGAALSASDYLEVFPYLTTPLPGSPDGPEPSRFSNLSTRGQVGSGDFVMIAGLIVDGDQPKRILITGKGPSLTPFGVPDALANPTLRLYRGQTEIAFNDNWMDASNAVEIGDTPGAPTIAEEAALLLTLDPGTYTAHLAGFGGTSGQGLVEVWELNASGRHAVTPQREVNQTLFVVR
jgi:hypothetical protein